MRWLWAFLVLLAVATPARSANGITGVTVQKFRGLTSVAITAIVQGDDDSSAVFRIFQKWSDAAAYDTGMVMVRRPHGSGGTAAASGEIFEGRILFMTPGRTASFYLQGKDAGGDFTTAIDTTSCSVVPNILASGPVYYVNQATGASGHGGLSPSDAMATINQALTKLAASTLGGANGGIIVAPGHYHERLDLNFGDDGYPRFLMGDGTNVDSTIICGANEEVESGNQKVGTALSWSARPGDVNKADSTYATPFPDTVGLVVIGWGELLHRKASLLGLARDTIQTNSCTSAPVGVEVSGWFWQKGASAATDTLFVKRRNGASPSGITLHAGYRDELIDVERRNWHISRLTFRFAGGILKDYQGNAITTAGNGKVGDPNPSATPALLANGCAGTRSVSGLVIDSCKFIGNAGKAIVTSNICLRSDSVTITHCYFDNLSNGTFGYSACKCHPEEIADQPAIRAAYSAFNWNIVTGTFNGVGIDAAATDSSQGLKTEICGNVFTNFYDDGIELDDAHNLNDLVMGNVCRNTGTGLSAGPIFTGPVFFFWNSVLNAKFRGVKAGGNTGIVKVYNNTFISNTLETGGTGGGQAFDDTPGPGASVGFSFRNNVMIGKEGTALIYGPSSGGSTSLNDFNYDLMDTTSKVTQLMSWNGTGYSWNGKFRDASGDSIQWEANGVLGNAAFGDTTANRGLIWLRSSSSAIGRAQRITGVNTTINGRVYTDIGSHPRGPLQ